MNITVPQQLLLDRLAADWVLTQRGTLYHPVDNRTHNINLRTIETLVRLGRLRLDRVRGRYLLMPNASAA